MDVVYFDNAATTPLDEEVLAAMQNAMLVYGNPSSLHADGRKAKALIESERRKIAQFLNCLPSEIVFTSGGTEADNLAVLGVVEANHISTIISSRLEHPAILESIKYAQSKFNTHVIWVNVLDDGSIDYSHLKELLSNNPKSLVSLMHVNNEIGNITDLQKIGEWCQEYKAIFHTDAVKSLGHLKIDLNELGIDLLSGSAHKIYGPKGVGFLFIRKGVKLSSQILGGKQEREARGGTENTIGIAGLGQAIDVLSSTITETNKYIAALKQYFISELKERVPSAKFNGQSENDSHSSNAIVSVNFMGLSTNELLLFQLDLNGVMVSGGSACSSGSLKGSHVLKTLGVDGASLRFSFSKYNTKEEIDFVIDSLWAIVKE